MTHQPKFKPGILGSYLKSREAMGRLKEASSQWCQAFDVGDNEAMTVIGTVWSEALTDFSKAMNEITAFGEKSE